MAREPVTVPSMWFVLTNPPEVWSKSIDPIEWLKEDILQNLKGLLNSRQGRSVGHRNFGIPDVTELLARPHWKQLLIQEIKAAIERCEPRIAAPVEVRLEKVVAKDAESQGLFPINLEIRARLAFAKSEVCNFRTTILADGPTEIRQTEIL
jgi:predicted component of type VI protein secretion system